tara:strand:- start:541 stop:678 length:138 start_codon:yes stop_codon:yes gene_type:complete
VIYVLLVVKKNNITQIIRTDSLSNDCGDGFQKTFNQFPNAVTIPT